MRLLTKVMPRGNNPIRTIGWVIAVFTLLGGVYLFTPLYSVSVSQTGLSALASAFSHPTMILLWGAFLIVSSFLVILGLWKDIPQIRSAGFFGILLARFFQLLTTFLVAGFYPITWIYPLTITVIILVLWIHERTEVNRLVQS